METTPERQEHPQPKRRSATSGGKRLRGSTQIQCDGECGEAMEDVRYKILPLLNRPLPLSLPSTHFASVSPIDTTASPTYSKCLERWTGTLADWPALT